MVFVGLIVPIESKNAIAQSRLPREINIGVPSLASSIGKLKISGNWGGFCPLFSKELEKELKQENPDIIVKLPLVANVDIDRYYGLKKGLLQIECGPNTIISDQTILKEKGWEHIEFSNPFHTTGIKILLTKEFAKSREDPEGNISRNKLNDIKIGVIFDTTTYYQLKNKGYNFETFSSLSEALKALEEGEKIQAYAADALILNTILESDYQNEGYILYPQEKEKYLPETELENYGLVVAKNFGYSQLLLEKINKTLETANIKEYQKKLKNQETGKTKQQLLEEQDRYITKLLQDYKQTKDSNRNLIFVIAILSITTVVLTSLLIMQYFKKNSSN